jgi:hypothetical protein
MVIYVSVALSQDYGRPSLPPSEDHANLAQSEEQEARPKATFSSWLFSNMFGHHEPPLATNLSAAANTFKSDILFPKIGSSTTFTKAFW